MTFDYAMYAHCSNFHKNVAIMLRLSICMLII